MNKLTRTLALGTALTLGAAAPRIAHAASIGTTAPVIQTLATPELSAAQFNKLFQPIAGAMHTDTISYANNPDAGTVTSQVFQGIKDPTTGQDATGLYAYAYKITATSSTNAASGEPVQLQSTSWQFNSTPTGSTFAGGTSPAYAYVIKSGTVGGLTNTTAADGTAPIVPTSLSWAPGQKIGSIQANFFNAASQTAPIGSGESSATFVVLSKQPFNASSLQNAGVLSTDTQNGKTQVFVPSGGDISAVPVPEPTTLLAWAGMAGAVVFVRRTRKAARTA